LIDRVNQLVEWTNLLGVMKSLWISGLFNPMSYLTLTAVMQMTARQFSLPLDYMTNRSHFTNYADPKDIPGMPSKGVYVHGLFMEGAGWEPGKGDEEGYITDSKLKELHPASFFWEHVIDSPKWDWLFAF
jgi:dynein heavy chain